MKKASFKARIRYQFDNFMSGGGLSIFLALLIMFVIAFIVMGLIRFAMNALAPDSTLESVEKQFWRVFLQIADAGAVAEDSDSSIINKVVGIITIFAGLVLFSSLVAFITSQFEIMLSNMRKGKSRVIENNHTLILGCNERTVEIIRELIIANESERHAAVVVLSDKEKDWMDDFFREQIEELKTTKIITRSGVSSSIRVLEKISVQSAKSIVILNDVGLDAEEEEKALADARVLKTIMAIVACVGQNPMPPIIAELHQENKRTLAKSICEGIFVIEEHMLLAKLIVQTSRVSGLALVYDELVGFDGCELYFHQKDGGYGQKSYGQMSFHYPECSLIGLRNSDSSVVLNPPAATIVQDDQELILIAEDDSTIRYSNQAAQVSQTQFKPGSPMARKTEKQLVVGWSSKTAVIVDEYSQYMVEGSGIDVLITQAEEQITAEFKVIQARYPTIQLRIIEGDVQNSQTVSDLHPENYDNVIILKEDGGNPELRDSATIAILLEFRRYFRTLGEKNVKTQLISEVADSANIEIIQEVGVKDFLISNKFVSKIYAQASEEPGVLDAYAELFKAEGSEIYLKPVSLFLDAHGKSICFADLCAAALARGESCFGVRIAAEENDASRRYGIHINPDKDAIFVMGPEDCLLTLAEDEF